jgi:hypothetical protein
MDWLNNIPVVGPLWRGARRLHRDERGDMFEYILILLAVGIPMFAVSVVLKDILKDYFAMIAFYVGWPFL